MYAVKNSNGTEVLVSELPEAAIEYFAFDIAELPVPPDDESSYKLAIDFENKSFSLVKLEEPTKPTAESLSADEILNVLLGVSE